ncbi:MAG TPA: hypothetical protein VE954_25655 [Oligoflexus sp.]|nr:hypothetical protein [Oligoflexus sp.]
MKLSKTIAALGLTASSSAFGLMAPDQPVRTKTVCLNTYERADGSLELGTCDEAKNNKTEGRPRLENGCAEGQAAMTVTKWTTQQGFTPKIEACLPPNVVQL